MKDLVRFAEVVREAVQHHDSAALEAIAGGLVTAPREYRDAAKLVLDREEANQRDDVMKPWL